MKAFMTLTLLFLFSVTTQAHSVAAIVYDGDDSVQRLLNTQDDEQYQSLEDANKNDRKMSIEEEKERTPASYEQEKQRDREDDMLRKIQPPIYDRRYK